MADQKAETVFQQVIQEQQGEPKDKKRQEAEGELTIIKGIGNNSPEMKALQKEIEEVMPEN